MRGKGGQGERREEGEKRNENCWVFEVKKAHLEERNEKKEKEENEGLKKRRRGRRTGSENDEENEKENQNGWGGGAWEGRGGVVPFCLIRGKVGKRRRGKKTKWEKKGRGGGERRRGKSGKCVDQHSFCQGVLCAC